MMLKLHFTLNPIKKQEKSNYTKRINYSTSSSSNFKNITHISYFYFILDLGTQLLFSKFRQSTRNSLKKCKQSLE